MARLKARPDPATVALDALTVRVKAAEGAIVALQTSVAALQPPVYLPPPPPPVVVPPPPVGGQLITTPEALDQALKLAIPGDVLLLASSLVYPGALTLTYPVTLVGSSIAGRMTATLPLPSFRGGLTIEGDNIILLGLEVRHTRFDTDIVVIKGATAMLDRCRILGDPVHGAKRGIGANSNGNCVITRCYIDDCFQPSPGYDSQAICAWDCGPGLLIEDNFLRAGSETIMLGGADSSSVDRIPSDVIIRGNTITANPAWNGQPIGVKTRLELKCARRVLIEKNDISQVWIQGQAGYLVSFTVKNQDGGAPWSVIEDVTFQDNTCSAGVAALNILATDYAYPSGHMARVTIRRNTFAISSPLIAQEAHKLILIGQATTDLTIDSNTFTGQFVGSQLYMDAAPKHVNFTLTNNKWPTSLYGVFGSDCGHGQAAWDAHVAGGTFAGNVEI